jgi:hypothetical protein
MTEEVGVVAVMVMVMVMVMLEAVAGLPPCRSRYCHRRLRVTPQVRSKAGIPGFSFRSLSRYRPQSSSRIAPFGPRGWRRHFPL